MAAAVGAAAIWRERTGKGQNLSIDIRQAAHGINPELTFHPTINGHPYNNWMGGLHPFSIFPYKTKDERWVYPSGVYPHQHNDWSNFFNCGISHKNIATSIAKWNSDELEDAANAERPDALHREIARGMAGSSPGNSISRRNRSSR